MTTTGLLETALHDEHVRLGGRMVPFAGWEMPVQYAGVVEEHLAVRNAAGMFDVSHMNRTSVTGSAAADLLRRTLTYHVHKLQPGQGHYTLMCNEDGGILDDPYVYRISDGRWLFVGNASNAERDVAQLRAHARSGEDVAIDDVQRSTVMIALQGPTAVATFAEAVDPAAASNIGRRRCGKFEWHGERVFASRTGYTGEDGFELVTDNETGRRLWRVLLEAGVTPCGLGARDTLRLEACLALYGNDIDEGTNPFEAGLGWVVSLDDDADFTGRPALERLAAEPTPSVLTPFQATERGVMRPHYPVLAAGEQVAEVRSGGFSPTLSTSIAMAYLPRDLAEPGTPLQVDARGRLMAAVVVKRPFYRRTEG